MARSGTGDVRRERVPWPNLFLRAGVGVVPVDFLFQGADALGEGWLDWPFGRGGRVGRIFLRPWRRGRGGRSIFAHIGGFFSAHLAPGVVKQENCRRTVGRVSGGKVDFSFRPLAAAALHPFPRNFSRFREVGDIPKLCPANRATLWLARVAAESVAAKPGIAAPQTIMPGSSHAGNRSLAPLTSR